MGPLRPPEIHLPGKFTLRPLLEQLLAAAKDQKPQSEKTGAQLGMAPLLNGEEKWVARATLVLKIY